MKKIKKLMAAVLAVVMTMALSVTAFAVSANQGSLTVKVTSGNSLEGQTVHVYRLFDEDNGSYVVNPAYETILKQVLNLGAEAKSGDIYQAVQKLGVNDSAQVQKFADDFTAKALEQQAADTATSGKLTAAHKESYTFDGLAYGYYLVYQTGTQNLQSSLVNVTQPANEVNLKGTTPGIDKQADKTSVEIGNVVTYTITGTIPDTTGYAAYVYKINDTLSAGLDFVADVNGTAWSGADLSVSVQIAGGTAETQQAAVTDRTMVLDLSKWVRDNQAHVGKKFTVTYYAKVNSNAVVNNVKNSASLEYGNKPGETTTTVPDVVETPTYSLDVDKVIKGTTTMLADAAFHIYRNEQDALNNTNAIKVTGTAGNYKVDPTSSNMDMVSVGTEITTGVNLHLNGLAAGDYWLVETAAPEGYNKLSAPIKVTIAKGVNPDGSNWTIQMDGTPEADKIIDIENSTGTILPGTGGMGTMLFTVIAVVLIVGVGVSFVRSRKKSEQ